MENSMAERESAGPTHRVYTVIRREGQDDYWLNIGLAFPHKDGNGFNRAAVSDNVAGPCGGGPRPSSDRHRSGATTGWSNPKRVGSDRSRHRGWGTRIRT